MSDIHLPSRRPWGRILPLAVLLLVPSCSLVSKHSLSTSSALGSGGAGTDLAEAAEEGDLQAERADRVAKAKAARDAFFAKDCATLKDGDFDELMAVYRRSPSSLTIEDRVEIARRFVGCERDVELFEKVVADVSWDMFIEKFPSDVAWLPRLEAYVSSGSARFPDSELDNHTVLNLWVWVMIARRDGVSKELCKVAFAHRANLAPRSAGSPLAFACANAGNAKAVATLVPDLLTSEDWQLRADGCEALALIPKAASPKVAKVVKEMSYADPYQRVSKDSDGLIDKITHPVQEQCLITTKKIELTQ